MVLREEGVFVDEVECASSKKKKAGGPFLSSLRFPFFFSFSSDLFLTSSTLRETCASSWVRTRSSAGEETVCCVTCFFSLLRLSERGGRGGRSSSSRKAKAIQFVFPLQGFARSAAQIASQLHQEGT